MLEKLIDANDHQHEPIKPKVNKSLLQKQPYDDSKSKLRNIFQLTEHDLQEFRLRQQGEH